MNLSPLTLGIDVGTQSTKVVLYDAEKKMICAAGSSPHKIISRSDGTSEQDAIWWEKALIESLETIPSDLKKRIAAVGVSGQQHGFVPLDIDGNVITNVKLWNDTSTALECIEIETAAGGRDNVLSTTGNCILPGYTASKVLWFKKNHPRLYERLHTILLPHDYINYLLTGNLAMEFGDASGTGFLNIKNRTWSKEILQCIDPARDLSQCLPQLLKAESSVGRVSQTAAEKFGLPKDILVSTGGGDNMMAAIGMGNVMEGVAGASLGTSGTLFSYSETPVIDNTGTAAAFCSSTGGFLPLVCIMNGTVSTQLITTVLELPVDKIDPIAAKAPIGCEGVLTLPFFTGERTPNLPFAKGAIFGLTALNFTRNNLLRSAMESTMFALRGGKELLNKSGIEFDTVNLTGGGSKSRLWRQMCADILQCKVKTPVTNESAAFGAALQSLWMLENATGKESSIEDIVKAHVQFEEQKVKPEIKAVEQYNKIYSNYLEALKLMTPGYTERTDNGII
ncbi:MAG: xylulokinase [Deltaproteobacteria bacterium]|nr:xylulokinase [Deltaproteobacteria bacterium]